MDNFAFVRGFHSSSASPSDIYLVQDKKTDRRYIMKLFLASDSMLNYEAKMYQSVQKNILGKQISPFFVGFYKKINNIKFDELKIWLNKYVKKDIDTRLRRNILYMYTVLMYPEYIDRFFPIGRPAIDQFDELENSAKEMLQETSKLTFAAILTNEVQDNVDLFNTVYDLKKEQFRQIPGYIAMVLTGLYALNSIKITHNDIHHGNIFMSNKYRPDKSGTAKSLVIGFDQYIFFIYPGDKAPFIFDFDRATKEDDENKMVDEFSRYGQCSDFNARRDILKFMCEMIRSMDEKACIKWYYELLFGSNVSNPKVKKLIKSIDRGDCFFSNREESYLCINDYLDLMSSPAAIVSGSLSAAEAALDDRFTTEQDLRMYQNKFLSRLAQEFKSSGQKHASDYVKSICYNISSETVAFIKNYIATAAATFK